MCKENRAVTTAGMMRNHAGTEYAPGGRWRKDCTGEGRPPDRIVDPIAEAEQRGYERAVADLRAEAARYEEAARGTAAIGWDAYDLAADWLASRKAAE